MDAMRLPVIGRLSRRMIDAMLCMILSLTLASSAFGEEQEEFAPHNVVSVILGGTTNDDESASTIGLDFERRIHPLLGVGAVVEYVTDDLDAFTLIGALDFHLWRGLMIQTGPGVEFAGEEEDEKGRSVTVNRRSFVYRVGVLYEFEIGELFVIPQVHYDYSSAQDAVVYAMGFGFEF